MARPPRYERDFGFTDWALERPKEPLPGDQVDSELDDVSLAVNATQDALALIQREDGELGNETVGVDQLKPEMEAWAQGFAGAASAPGPMGPAGPQIPGPVGVGGPKGAPLPWLVGATIPSNQLGVIDQLALNTSNGDVYQKTSVGWVLAANIRGPAGTGGGTGVSDHGALTGLADADHPISAVQGLQVALNDLALAVLTATASQNRVYRQAGVPTGDLNAGDLWFDSDNGDLLYRWDGVEWIEVADARIETALANASSAISIASGAAAQVDGKVTTYYGGSAPVAPEEGDLWFRADQGNRTYRWSGTAWVDLQDAAISEALATAQSAEATADGKIVSFYQPNAPGVATASVGDLWIDTDDGNHPYRHNGAAWVSIRDATIAAAAAAAAAALNAAASAEATADGKIEVFYQTSPPAAGESGVGDLWIDTDNGNQLHRYNGTTWVSVQDAGIQSALTSAALAQDVADGKITAFYQTVAPDGASGRQIGDLWYDTDDNHRPYRFSGASWVDITPIVGVNGGLITGVSVANGAITAQKLSVSEMSAITANLGTMTAGAIALLNSGHIRAGQSGYNTGVGFFLGFDGATPKFSIGNPAGNYLRWTGSALEINATFAEFSASISGGNLSSSGANGTRVYGSRTVTVTGGKAPLTYEWMIANQTQGIDPPKSGEFIYLTGTLNSNVVGVSGSATNNILLGRVLCTVRDADGRVATAAFSVNATHGTPP